MSNDTHRLSQYLPSAEMPKDNSKKADDIVIGQDAVNELVKKPNGDVVVRQRQK